jgi:hypothetical protein
MNRFLNRIAIVAAVVFATQTYAAAQGSGDCNRNCAATPPSDWKTHSTTMTLPGSPCTMTITYRQRKNNCTTPATFEHELVSIDPGGDMNYCNSTLDVVLAAALKKIVEHNGESFEPNDQLDPCDNQTVLSVASCWFWDCYPNVPPGAPSTASSCVIYKCGEATCCWRKYKICWEDGKRVIKEVIGGTITGVSCPNPTWCDTYCDVLRFEGVATEIDPANWKRVAREANVGPDALVVEANGSNIILRTALNGNTVVGYDLTDITGAVVRSMSLLETASKNDIIIETRGLASGAYVIALRLSDGTRITKSVTIVK